MKAENIPTHIAIVMDGNGRWAQQKNLNRTEGHKASESTIMTIISEALDLGVKELSLFAFSTENWIRPISEVRFLMSYAKEVIRRQAPVLTKWGIKINWVGKEQKLWSSLLKEIQKAEEMSKRNNKMIVNFCINYGGRDEIVFAANKLLASGKKRITAKGFSKELMIKNDVDLLIRSSGEKRISNFLLWQIAYAEIVWIDKMWPDVDRDAFRDAVAEFSNRKRRFGGV